MCDGGSSCAIPRLEIMKCRRPGYHRGRSALIGQTPKSPKGGPLMAAGTGWPPLAAVGLPGLVLTSPSIRVDSTTVGFGLMMAGVGTKTGGKFTSHSDVTSER